MKEIKTHIRLKIPLSVTEAFDFWICADLYKAFAQHRFLPAIMGIFPQHGWSRPGETRTLYFDNTTTARETLLVVVPGFLFRSSISEFDSLFGQLIKELNYKCIFSSDATGQTELVVEFIFILRNHFSANLFKLLLRRTVIHYLRNSFERLGGIVANYSYSHE